MHMHITFKQMDTSIFILSYAYLLHKYLATFKIVK